MTDEKEPKQARSRLTKEAILTSAREILSQRGHLKTSITDVAERAGVSIGSVYQYFKDLGVLYHFLLESDLKEQMHKGDSIIREVDQNFHNMSDEEAMERLINMTFDALKSVYFLGKGIGAVMPKIQAELIKKSKDSAVKGITRIFTNHQTRLGLTKPDYTAFVVCHSAYGIIEALLERQEQWNEEAIKDEMKILYRSFVFRNRRDL